MRVVEMNINHMLNHVMCKVMKVRECSCFLQAIVITVLLSVSSTKIEGGHFNNRPNITDLPYLVLVLTSVRTCTGVLIDTLWVLTAAQCFGNIKSATVLTGLAPFKNGWFRIKSYEVIIHPNFIDEPSTYQSSTYQPDLALVRLRDPIELTSYTNIIQLEADMWPQRSYEMYNRECRAVGYTRKSEQMDLYVKTILAQHGQEACACYKMSSKQYLVCLQEAEVSLCEGMAGAPLVCANKLTGIAHRLFSVKSCYHPRKTNLPFCSDEETISVYVFICPHLNWIQKYVGHTPLKPTSCTAPTSTYHLQLDLLTYIVIVLVVII